MNIRYPFLKDELALQEIRKHKWIESEKQGREIGFATAAVDWVRKYGESWKQFRLKNNHYQNLFIEKRRERRFSYQWPIEIRSHDKDYSTQTKNVNLLGFSCLVQEPIQEQTPVRVRIGFQNPSSPRPLYFQFNSRVSRQERSLKGGAPTAHRIFIPFDEEARDYLRTHADRFLSAPVGANA